MGKVGSDHLCTWHRDKELDGIAVPMEAELSLSHGAVGDEATGCLVTAVVPIHMDDAPWAGALPRCWRCLVGWENRDRRLGLPYFQQEAGDSEGWEHSKCPRPQGASAEGLPRSPKSWPRCRTTAGEERERKAELGQKGGSPAHLLCELFSAAAASLIGVLQGWELTLSQGDGDDNPVASAHPQTVACNEEGCDAHEGEAQLAGT